MLISITGCILKLGRKMLGLENVSVQNIWSYQSGYCGL